MTASSGYRAPPVKKSFQRPLSRQLPPETVDVERGEQSWFSRFWCGAGACQLGSGERFSVECEAEQPSWMRPVPENCNGGSWAEEGETEETPPPWVEAMEIHCQNRVVDAPNTDLSSVSTAALQEAEHTLQHHGGAGGRAGTAPSAAATAKQEFSSSARSRLSARTAVVCDSCSAATEMPGSIASSTTSVEKAVHAANAGGDADHLASFDAIQEVLQETCNSCSAARTTGAPTPAVTREAQRCPAAAAIASYAPMHECCQQQLQHQHLADVWDERYSSVLPREGTAATPRQQQRHLQQEQQQQRRSLSPAGGLQHSGSSSSSKDPPTESGGPIASTAWAQRAIVLSISCVSAGAFATAAGGVLPVAIAAGSMGFTLGLLSSILGIRVGRWVS